MKIALVGFSPPTILTVFNNGPVPFVNIPGKWQTYNQDAGWRSPDNLYGLVSVTPAPLPDGMQFSGEATYTIDADGNVSEVRQTVPVPPPPSPPPPSTFVQGTDFLARLQDAEYQAIIAAAAQNVQLARWIEDLRLIGLVDVTDATAQAAKAALIQAGLLTQQRANAVFAPPA